MAPSPLRSQSAFLLAAVHAAASQYAGDVVVYGSTPGGIVAAVAAARLNATATVLLADPSPRLGGMCSGGLTYTDKGDTFAIGGIAHEFFVRVARHYNASATEPQYAFEPHVAELTLAAMLTEAGVRRVACGFVDTVAKTGTTISSFTTTDVKTFTGAVFIDATYEGDLLARGAVSYAVGREAQSVYNESDAGRREPFSRPFDFRPVSPLGDDGALLPLITGPSVGAVGTGDALAQAYNFRLCATATNFTPWPKPAGYNASDWELLRRVTQAFGPSEGVHQLFGINAVPGGKFDLNNGALVSTDMVGGSWAYTNATYVERERIADAHVRYQQGLLWTLANDEAVPSRLRADVAALGLCRDEFISNAGWPEQLYVREARRLVGDAVMTQQDIDHQTNFRNRSIGMGSYPCDGHYFHRWV